MSNFVHLHLHSEYSLLDGANRVDELVDRVAEMDQPAVAITDHGRIASTIPFIKKCQESGIKPIIGCEVYINDDAYDKDKRDRGGNYHLTLLAQNKIGFHNMVQMTSMASRDGFHHNPRMTKETLKDHSEGIILLTGCIGAELPQLITRGGDGVSKLMEWYQDVFGDRFRIEMMYHGEHQGVDHTRIETDSGEILIEEGQLNDELIRLSKFYSVPLIATNDAHYLHERDGIHHDTLICKGKGKFDPVRNFRFPGAKHDSWEFYVKTSKEMREVGTRWGKVWKAACKETVAVAEMIESEVVPIDQNIIPAFEIPQDPGYDEWIKSGEFIL